MGISYTSIINKEMRQASGQCYHIKTLHYFIRSLYTEVVKRLVVS